jgi:sugar (pentulose or hexulose) kinase
MWADEVCGRVTPTAARSLGLRAGTPVVGGFVDGSAAVIQTPMGLGQMAHNSGSTDVLAMCVEKPRPAEGILTRPTGVGRKFRDRWLAVRTIAAAGSALDWARRVMFSEMTDASWRRALQRCVEHSSTDVDLVCVPSFAGERASMKQ